jgi:hypothetical protein
MGSTRSVTGAGNAFDYRYLNRWLLGCLVAGLAWWFVLAMDLLGLPAEMTTCGSIRMLGRPCALCGMTRAVASLLAGDPGGAHRYNPAVIPLAIVMLLEVVARLVLAIRRVPDAYRANVMRLDRATHVAVVVLLAVLFVVG